MKHIFNHIILRLILLVLLAIITFAPGALYGQLTSSTADYSQMLLFPEYAEQSELFVFYQKNGTHNPGSLSATLPGTEDYNYDWSLYDPASTSFVPYHSDTATQSSTISDLGEGGYQVHIYNGTDTDTTILGWVMLNKLFAETEKTDEDKIKRYKYTCYRLVLTGWIEIDTFYYYDPVSFDTIPLNNEYHFKWTSDNPDLEIPNDTTVLDPNITYQPPIIDTWYILTAWDDMGMTVVDSVLYESIQTKADFTVEYYDKINDEFSADLSGNWSLDKGSLDALLTVKFINNSINGDRYEWVYLDTLGGIKENEFTEDLVTQPEHTYLNADKYYYPYLVSIHELDGILDECRDTFHLEEAIHVVKSQVSIPNVFSPNGDDINPVFVIKHQSLKSCKLTIVDRFGKVVYKMETDDIYSWEGWNGNIRNSDRPAPEGQYFYVFEAMGYDGIEYRDPSILEKRKSSSGGIFGGGSGSGTTTGQDPEASEEEGLYTGWLYLFRGSGNY